MTKTLLLLYIFTISWTAVLVPTPYTPIPVLFALATGIAFVPRVALGQKFSIASIRPEDALVGILPVWVALSAIFGWTPKSLNYVAAYAFVFLYLYIFLKVVMLNAASVESLRNANMWGVLFVCSYMVVHFALVETTGFRLEAYLDHVRADRIPHFLGFERQRGFSSEPAIAGFYLNTLGPLALWHLWLRKPWPETLKLIMTLVVSGAWITLFSAASVAALGLGAFAATALGTAIWLVSGARIRTHHTIRLGRAALFFGVGTALVMALVIAAEFIEPASEIILKKLTFSEDVAERPDLWRDAIGVILDAPIWRWFTGIGAGYFSANESAVVNWYLLITLEAGILFLATVLMFYAAVGLRIASMRSPFRSAYLIGFIAGATHLAANSTFQNAFLWLLISFAYVELARARDRLSRRSGSPSAMMPIMGS